MKKIVLLAALIGVGYYAYSEYLSPSDNKVTIKKLLDKVSSTSVSAQEAKVAFNNAMIELCEVNGVDTINGFGTTAECLNKLETVASEYCYSQITDFDSKTYTSAFDLKADYIVFDLCVTDIVGGEFPLDLLNH